MHAPALLLVALFTTGSPTPAEPVPENLLAGPVRCVLRYLDAVRLAGPRAVVVRHGRLPAPDERAYTPVKRLIAPRTLEEIERWAARGVDHPLAPWRDAASARILETFHLLAVRRAPHAAAVVTVGERFWRGTADGALERIVSEYLVARVAGAWRVVDRRAGSAFDDVEIAEGYAGFFDAAPVAR
jgi:hypothetical protein